MAFSNTNVNLLRNKQVECYVKSLYIFERLKDYIMNERKSTIPLVALMGIFEGVRKKPSRI